MNDPNQKYKLRPDTLSNDPTNLDRIKHDIRNLKRLTNAQIELLFSLPHIDKNEIILIYDDIISTIQTIIEAM
jgi:hypothetical protein